jgi:hypothetical protein
MRWKIDAGAYLIRAEGRRSLETSRRERKIKKLNEVKILQELPNFLFF